MKTRCLSLLNLNHNLTLNPFAQSRRGEGIKIKSKIMIKRGGLLALCVAAALSAHAATNAPASKASEAFTPLEPGDYSNWIELGFGGYFVDGNKAQLQRRTGQNGGLFGGVEDFHLEHALNKRATLTVDGRAMFGNNDYLLKLRVAEPEKGFLEFGYRSFRNWYDGSGGYFPRGTNRWFNLYDDDLFVDRAEVWIEGGVRVPDKPEFTFRYSHSTRDGRKPSTIWGDTALTGLSTTRGYVPTFLRIDEVRDSIALDVTHKIDKTQFGLGLRVESIRNDNSRNIHRRPGELTGSITQAADRHLTHREFSDTDLFNAHAFTVTRINDKLMLTLGGSFTRLDSDIGGSRIYGADYDAIYDPLFSRRQQRDEGFLDLEGSANTKQYVANLNLMYSPKPKLTVVPSVRIEHFKQDGFSEFLETDVGAGATRPPLTEHLLNTHNRSYTDVSEALEVRYSGITNWALYVRAEWLQGQGDLTERQAEPDPDATGIIERSTDSERFTQKYVAGANWYPHRRVNLAAQYYHKQRQNDYTHLVDLTTNTPPLGNRYPAFLVGQNFTTDDVNFRITLRPHNRLTLVSRYDLQFSTVDTRGDLLAEAGSTRMTSDIFSQSVSWTPVQRLYVQASANYAIDRTETPPGGFTGASTNNLLPTFSNNYWNFGALAGFAFNDRTDVQLRYNFYRSDNYTDNSLATMPYGSDAKEHSATATLNRQITKKLRWSLTYGFFDHRDKTYGGNNDYDAHLVYTSVQYRF